jgi:plastocyanin
MYEDDNATGEQPQTRHKSPAPRGNRALLLVGLGAALAAVASLVALTGANATPARVSAAPAAQSQQMAHAGTSQKSGQTAAGNRSGTDATSAHTQSADTQTAPKAAQHIAIKNYAFAPKSLTIPVGSTVTWTNEDTAPHTVTTSSGPAKISSANLSKGQSFSYTFTKAGTYQYYCAVHPDMTATITVTGSSGGTSGGTSGGSTGGTSGGTSGGSTGGTSGGSTGGMDGGTTGGTGGTGGDCSSVQQVLMPILQHINSAHLGESVGQQVQDALNLDNYLKMHTVWLESILTPATNGTTSIVDQTLTTLIEHLNAAHLSEPLGQQVQDILNPGQYVSSHLVLVEHLLAPTESYLTNSC